MPAPSSRETSADARSAPRALTSTAAAPATQESPATLESPAIVESPATVDSRLVLLAPSQVDRPRHRPFAAMAAHLRWNLGFERVVVAHLDAEPRLDAVLAGFAGDGAGRVRVLPLFLAMASHVRRELRQRIEETAEAHPGLDIRVLPLLGEENGFLDLLERLARRELTAAPDPQRPLATISPPDASTPPADGPRATLVPVAEVG